MQKNELDHQKKNHLKLNNKKRLKFGWQIFSTLYKSKGHTSIVWGTYVVNLTAVN